MLITALQMFHVFCFIVVFCSFINNRCIYIKIGAAAPAVDAYTLAILGALGVLWI